MASARRALIAQRGHHQHGVIEGNVRYIFQTGALMLGITLVLGVVAIVAVYWASRVSIDGRRRGCAGHGLRAGAGLFRR